MDEFALNMSLSPDGFHHLVGRFGECWSGFICTLSITLTFCDYYYSLKHVARFRWGVFGCALGARAPHSLLVAPRVEHRLQALLDALLVCFFTRARCRALGVRPLRSLLVAPNVVRPIQYLLDVFCLLPTP